MVCCVRLQSDRHLTVLRHDLLRLGGQPDTTRYRGANLNNVKPHAFYWLHLARKHFAAGQLHLAYAIVKQAL